MILTSAVVASLGSIFGTWWVETTMDKQLKAPVFLIARVLEDVKERLVWKSILSMITSERGGAPGPENVGTLTTNPMSTPVLLGVMMQVRENVVPS